MMKLTFGYGHGVQTVDIPERNIMAVLTANEVTHTQTGESAVRDALANPIGAPLLREIAKERQIILFSCRKTDGR